MKTYFGMQLTIEEAQVKTIKECISSLPEPTKGRLFQLFKCMKKLWNHFSAEVDRFQCQNITIPKLSSKSNIYLVLPNENTPLVLTVLQRVCERHNAFLADLETFGESFKKENLATIPISYIKEESLLGCKDLQEYIREVIFNFSFRTSNGDLNWDLQEVNEKLIELFKFRPLISYEKQDLDHITFQYKSKNTTTKVLKLPDQTMETIATLEVDITQKAVKQLETVLQLITNLTDSNSNSGKTTISSFITEVIKEKPILPLFGDLQIGYTSSILHHLNSHLKPDKLAEVGSAYREPLEQARFTKS